MPVSYTHLEQDKKFEAALQDPAVKNLTTVAVSYTHLVVG